MTRKLVILTVLALLVLLASGATISAQDDTDTEPATETQATVNIFAVICEDRAVVNLTGTMLPGLDVYFQVFSGAQGGGVELSSLRRINASGAFTFSEIVEYPADNTVPVGSTGSVYVTISEAGAPQNSDYNEFVDDVQDGCAEPQNPLGTSSVDGGNAFPLPGGGTGADFDPNPGTNEQGTSTILSPFGGVINPNYVPPRKGGVVIGARDEFVNPRQETAGIIFAECDAYPVAEPGIIYDTDNVVVFWSWFAETPELVQQHINNVDYSVTYYQTLPLPNVTRTEIREINGLFWVFYYAQLGNLLPGEYWIEYKVEWDEPISDGFEDFGPGTDNERIVTGCSFDILANEEGINPSHNPWPFQD